MASQTPAKTPKATSTTVSSTDWVKLLIAEINLQLIAQGSKKRVALTANNIANLQRIIAGESAGNQAGFLRDNNPFNLGTWSSPHSGVYGGTTIPEFGIYVNTFASPLAGAQATAQSIVGQSNNSALLKALVNDSPTAIFGGALSSSAWKGAGYASPTGILKYSPFTGSSSANSGLPTNVSITTTGIHSAQDLQNVAGAAVNAATGGLAGNIASATGLGGVAGLGTLVGDLTSGTWWKRIGIGAGGIALIIGGTVLFLSQTQAGKQAIGVATTVATRGKG
jgi:hypothetical protein